MLLEFLSTVALSRFAVLHDLGLDRSDDDETDRLVIGIGLHHVGRAVTDLSAAVADLATLTGWPIQVRTHSPLIDGRPITRHALAGGPNGWLELIEVAGAAPSRREVNEPGVTHAAIQAPRMERVLARLIESEMDRHDGPVRLGTGFEYLYVRDTEGSVTEVEGAGHAPAEHAAWLGHGALATSDIDRLRSAYLGLVGVETSHTTRVRHHPEFDRGTGLTDGDVTVTWVPLANANVEIWQYHHPPTHGCADLCFESPGCGHLAFECHPVEFTDVVHRAVEHGFDVADPPRTNDGVRLARLRDPDGNWAELLAFDELDDRRSLRQRPELGCMWTMNALLER